MFRIQARTGIILAESIGIILLAASLGWYYYHVQTGLQYTGDPLYGPNGYQTQWIIGAPTSNATFTVQHSTNQSPTSNITTPFSVEARQMNSYLTISFIPCANWLFQNTTSQRPPPTCTSPATMSMYLIESSYCEPSPAKPILRESYIVQYHASSNVLYESGNITTPTTTSARFPVPAGDYCIIIVDTGQTDLSVLMNARLEFTAV